MMGAEYMKSYTVYIKKCRVREIKDKKNKLERKSRSRYELE